MKWADPYINLSVIVSFFFYLSSISTACWWNVPENNLQINAVGSALMLLIWNTFDVLHYLSIKMFLKEKDSLIDNVLFTSMSLGIRHCSFITDSKSHLHWQSIEMPSATIITLCSLHTNQNEFWMQIKLSDSSFCSSYNNEAYVSGGES